MDRAYPCLCCGFWTITSPVTGTYEICPVCFWEDDPVQNTHPLFEGGANEICLEQARRNYIDFGACQLRLRTHVRPPTSGEFPREGGAGDPRVAVLALVRAILCGSRTIIDASLQIAILARRLEDPAFRDPLLGFIEIESELDAFPVGDERALWDQEALDAKDAQLEEYEIQLRKAVLAQCRELEPWLRDHLLLGADL